MPATVLHRVVLGHLWFHFQQQNYLDKWKLLWLERGEGPRPTYQPPSVHHTPSPTQNI